MDIIFLDMTIRISGKDIKVFNHNEGFGWGVDASLTMRNNRTFHLIGSHYPEA